MAVRGWLLHADQGKELLTTSNIFTVCLLSADCRHPEKALDSRLLTLAQNGCLEKQIHNYIAWPTQSHRYSRLTQVLKCTCYHVCMNTPPPPSYTHTPTHSPTLLPADEVYLIKTPDSSKPFAVTFCCRSTGKKSYFLWKIQQIYDELWELKPIWSHAPLWHLWGSANHTFQHFNFWLALATVGLAIYSCTIWALQSRTLTITRAMRETSCII